ncbi:MAG: GatB/YqeY domain-containing protein [Tissierellia bacterium]|nr:GatB/YqeY domain-containing protein [Tissierellia bacterium]
MSYKDRLMADLKDAMRNKDKLKKDTITMVRAAIKQKEVDERKDLGDEDILGLISKEVKERRSSIEEFKKGNRQDLVDKTQKEIDLLMDYLPEQLSPEKVEAMVKETIDKKGLSGMKDMGALMAELMPRLKGRADGKLVNQLASKFLK